MNPRTCVLSEPIWHASCGMAAVPVTATTPVRRRRPARAGMRPADGDGEDGIGTARRRGRSAMSRWDPFREMLSLREAMNQLLEESVVRPAPPGAAGGGGGASGSGGAGRGQPLALD